jgi:hypothetical protein
MFYNTTTGQWENLPTDPNNPPQVTIVNGVGTITVSVPHFTAFAVMGQLGVTTSQIPTTSTSKTTTTSTTTTAKTTTVTTTSTSDTTVTTTKQGFVVSVSNLNISPKQVKPGEQVTISVEVANTGDTAGTKTVTFNVNKVVEQTKSVTLEPGAKATVSITTTDNIEGNYLVEVEGLSGNFTVTSSTTPSWIWPLVIGVAAVVIILGVGLFIYRRQREV